MAESEPTTGGIPLVLDDAEVTFVVAPQTCETRDVR